MPSARAGEVWVFLGGPAPRRLRGELSRLGIEHDGEPEGRSHVPTEEACEATSSEVRSGEPPRNRTENPQIKSLLLCQLS